jgi:tellurium resistance protein TerZ
MAISLQKGQRVALSSEGGLRQVVMGLGWDVKKPTGIKGLFSAPKAIDLDASCVLFDEHKKAVDAVWFRQLKSVDGSIRHTGDNRTGAGDGDDEQIIVDLPTVPAGVKSIVFVVNSFTGESFSQIDNAFCRIVDKSTNRELARYDLSCNGSHTAMVMGKVYRHESGWKFHAVGEPASGRTFVDLAPAMSACL